MLQLEDLLTALAERRSFPETLLLVARVSVGDVGSAGSAPVFVDRSELVLDGRPRKKKQSERAC